MVHVAILTISILFFASFSAAVSLSQARSLADWILTCQITSGQFKSAIAMSPVKQWIEPDNANYAAQSLALASQLLEDPKYLNAAKNHVAWMAANLNPKTGYSIRHVFNTTLNKWVSQAPDSTDTYGASFINAARAIGSTNVHAMSLALKAIVSTQQSNGLTWAQPSWHDAYLMDNAQVYGGLADATALKLPGAAQALIKSRGCLTKVMWNASLEQFGVTFYIDYGCQCPAVQPLNWTYFYPDGVAQMSAIEYNVPVSTAGRAALIRAFLARFPRWFDPNQSYWIAGNPSKNEQIFYWPHVGHALAVAGQKTLASQGIGYMIQYAQSHQYDWPFSVGSAAEMIFTLGKLL